jgi:hypothetical protein
MGTHEFILTTPPDDARARELWLQHAAGFILFEDARQYAIDEIDGSVTEEARKAILKGIDDAMYGIMMILDGVTGALRNEHCAVTLEHKVKLLKLNNDNASTVEEMDLADGDGMCMGFHGWLEDDYGTNRPARMKNDIK